MNEKCNDTEMTNENSTLLFTQTSTVENEIHEKQTLLLEWVTRFGFVVATIAISTVVCFGGALIAR